MTFKVAVRVASFAAVLVSGSVAAAQANLPQAPGAGQKVNNGGGPSMAAASVEGRGGSALEPYLVTWLLPVSGILTVLVAVFADRNIRNAYVRRR